MRARFWLVFACGAIQALGSAGQELPPHGVPDSPSAPSTISATVSTRDLPADTRSSVHLDQSLRGAAARVAPATPLLVMVWLRDQPAPALARELRAERAAEREILREELHALHASVMPPAPLPAVGEHQYVDSLRAGKALLGDAQRIRVAELAGELERLDNELRRELAERLAAAVAADQDALAMAVQQLGGRVTAVLPTVNAAVVEIPAGQLALLAAGRGAGLRGVTRISALPPARPELDLQNGSLGVDDGFWAEGVTGEPWDVGVLDSGVQQDHPAFAGIGFESRTGTFDPTGHGTAVTGIIASGHADFRGFAYGIERVLVGSASSSQVLSDAEWMVGGTADGPEAINVSYGYGTADTDDSDFDRFWDALVDTHRVMLVKSAGNGGPELRTLTRPASAYNVLSVANVDDRDNVPRTDDRVWFTSSRGPTVAGRKKPDLAAPGERTHTTAAGWSTGPRFADLGGSSAAAPHVTSAAILLAHLQGGLDPLAVKAVLINSADTWSDNGTPENEGDDGPGTGSRWSPAYGWGYLDLWEAWLNGLDVFVGSVSREPASAPSRRYFVGDLFVDEKVTVTWNRHVGPSSDFQAEDLSDLDLMLFDVATGSVRALSASRIDNVEQVAAGSDGRFVAAVDLIDVDPDVGTETFALAAEEGWREAAAPRVVTAAAAQEVAPGEVFAWTLTVENPGDLPLFRGQVELSLPAGFRLAAGSATRNLGQLAAGSVIDVTWQVEAPAEHGVSATFTWTATGDAYGRPSVHRGTAPVSVDDSAGGGETSALFADGFESGDVAAWSAP